MKRKTYLPIIILISIPLLLSCHKQNAPEYFAQTNVNVSYDIPQGVTDTILPITIELNCQATNAPEYQGSLDPYADKSSWNLKMQQGGKIDHSFYFGSKGLTAQYNQATTITRGDTVTFTLTGKFQINMSADVTKVYLINQVDTLVVP